MVLVADIVGFSTLEDWHQHEAVEWLVKVLQERDFWKEHTTLETRVLNSTGDGFLLAVPAGGAEVGRAAAFIELALELVDAVKQFTPSQRPRRGGRSVLQIRVGLHIGLVRSTLAVGSTQFAVGAGLNWTSRIAQLGGPSQVLVSEELWNYLAAIEVRRSLEFHVHPRPEKEPHLASVKHGVFAAFRVARRNGPSGRRTRPKHPPRIAENAKLDATLEASLKLTLEVATTAFRKLEPRWTLDALQPRASLWMARGDHLALMPYEAHLPEAGDFPSMDRRTSRYRKPSRRNARPEGPVAEAWQTGQSVLVTGLPVYGLDPVGYQNRLAAHGLAPGKVASFGRRPCSILCVPLPLLDRPVGVLCLDTKVDLANVAHGVEQIAEEIKLFSGYYLGALLKLRAG